MKHVRQKLRRVRKISHAGGRRNGAAVRKCGAGIIAATVIQDAISERTAEGSGGIADDRAIVQKCIVDRPPAVLREEAVV